MANNQIGPLQLIAFGFDDPQFSGQIGKEIKKLNDNKVLRLVDGLAIQKDHYGEITAVEASQLSLKEATEYGAVIGGLLGLAQGDEDTAEYSSRALAASFHDRYEYGLDKEDILDLADEIPAGSAAVLVLVEHLWAIPLRDAVRKAGGMLIAQDFLNPAALVSSGRPIYVIQR